MCTSFDTTVLCPAGGLALGDLAWSNESNQERIGRAGGIPPIIAGMHAHPTHSGTQGGLALGNLASLCTANRKLIAHAGGIPAICKSMKTNLQVTKESETQCETPTDCVLKLTQLCSTRECRSTAVGRCGTSRWMLSASTLRCAKERPRSCGK